MEHTDAMSAALRGPNSRDPFRAQNGVGGSPPYPGLLPRPARIALLLSDILTSVARASSIATRIHMAAIEPSRFKGIATMLAASDLCLVVFGLMAQGLAPRWLA